MPTKLRLNLGPDQPIIVSPRGSNIAIQPEPRSTKVVTSPNGDFTCIQRRWWPGEASRCRLCPSGRCVVDDDLCCFGVRGTISLADARLFDTHGLAWAETG